MNQRDEEYIKMRNFKYIDVIGYGASGVVYLVYDPIYKRNFALKSVFESKFNQTEVDCMKEVDDSNVIRLYKYEYYDGAVYLLMEYCPISLDKYIKKRQKLSYNTIIKYSIGILKAIKACHKCSIAHLDIKPANFLIDEYDRIRVCDFGLSSKHCTKELDSQYAGSVPFMAPEILLKTPHDSFKADIWAVGVTLFILATGKLPWPGDERDVLCRYLLTTPPMTEIIESQELAEAIKICLKKNPDERPTIDQLMAMPVFRESSSTVIKHVPRYSTPMKFKKGCYSQTTFVVQPRVHRIKLQELC